MTCDEIMQKLEKLGDENTRRIYLNHGAKEPLFGVKVGDLKPIVKQVKKDHELSLALFDTGNMDAMYLAGLVADEQRISRQQLQKWADKANCYMLSEYTVAWVAAESPHGLILAREWIRSPEELISDAGWATYGSILALLPDAELDMKEIKYMLKELPDAIHKAPNRTRYAMNAFVICAGTYVGDLQKEALAAARKIGKVSVDLGGTACKVPVAEEYIEKVRKMGRVGKKRKTVRC